MAVKKFVWGFGIIFFLFLFLPGYTKLQQLKEKNRDLESKIKKINIDNTLLQQELKRIESDPVYQEKIAREKMGIVRKGEIPIKIIPKKKE